MARNDRLTISGQTWAEFDNGSDPQGVRPGILKSWHRSRRACVSHESLDLGGTGEASQSRFIDVAAPVLLGMAELLGGSSVSLALAGVDGRILWRWACERWLYSDLDNGSLIPGASFAESDAGTNGIGVALQLERTALVVGEEHYKLAWRPWACIATPIADPVDRRIIGVVNIGLRATEANQFLGIAIRTLATQIESAFLAAAGTGQRRMLDTMTSFRRKFGNRPMIALNADTMIVEGRIPGFKADHEQLWELCRGRSGRTISLTAGHTARVLTVTPGRDRDGFVLAVDDDGVYQLSTPPDAGLPHSLGPLEEAEVSVLRQTLAECRGNKSAAAQRLAISRGTLYRKMRAYHLTTE